jgi:dTDP-4-amino-4,6-dideoxygalactose transaminase
LQSAILSVKLKYLEEWTRRRQACARAYGRALAGSGVITPREPNDATAVYHLYVVRVPPGQRAALQRGLSENGIHTGIHYPIALPLLEAYSYLGHREDEFPHAVAASQEILSLPMFAELTDVQIQHVAEQIRACLASA